MSTPNLFLYSQLGRFPSKKNHNYNNLKNTQTTQTSKTILQLAEQELHNAIAVKSNPTQSTNVPTEGLKNNSSAKLRILERNSKENSFSVNTKQLCPSPHNERTHITFVVANKDKKTVPVAKNNRIFSPSKWSRFSVREIRIKSFNVEDEIIAHDTDSEDCFIDTECEVIKNTESSLDNLINSQPQNKKQRPRSLSPLSCSPRARIVTFQEDETSGNSLKLRDKFNVLLSQVKATNWDVSIKGLMEIAKIAEELEYDRLFSCMPEINQRLIEFLRSPRSHVCRISCQIAGRFFEAVKDTRRPEFDEIVDLLLLRTADANKFIRNDANLALDSLIMHVPAFHSIRAISQKAPTHKNDLVRITSARLMVCIVGLAGPELFLNSPANEATRKRLLQLMAKFILDKNISTREYGIRLYEALYKHPNFDIYTKKILSKNNLTEIKKIMKNVPLN